MNDSYVRRSARCPQLGRVARHDVAEAVHVVAQRGGQQPLALGAGHGADGQVGQDAARVRDRRARAVLKELAARVPGAGCRAPPALSARGRCTVRPLGVYQRAVVSLIATSSPSG